MAVCKKMHDSPFHPHLLCVGQMEGRENKGYAAMNAEKVELDVFWGKPLERRAIAHKALTLISTLSLLHTHYIRPCVCLPFQNT